MQDTKERYFLKVRKDFGIEIEKQFGFEEEKVSVMQTSSAKKP